MSVPAASVKAPDYLRKVNPVDRPADPADLLTLAREHDLPPRWDGHPVTWTSWGPVPAAFLCPPPAGPRCPSCHTDAGQLHAAGTILRELRTSSTGSTGSVVRARTGGPLGRLDVFRCTGCQLDTVHDQDGGIWDLDATDYGPNGSQPPAALLDAPTSSTSSTSSTRTTTTKGRRSGPDGTTRARTEPRGPRGPQRAERAEIDGAGVPPTAAYLAAREALRASRANHPSGRKL